MSHPDVIRAYLTDHPGLTDREISRATGITRVQQVNAICLRLAADGTITRQRGPMGTMINVPTGMVSPHDAAARRDRALPRSPHRITAQRSHDLSPLLRLNPVETLIILPCSATKARGGGMDRGPALTAALPDDLAAELTQARASVAAWAHLTTDQLCPAWRRYAGTYYTAARDALADMMARGAHVLILSGGYGVVDAREPIGTYEARMTRSWWRHGILERCLAAYARAHGLTEVAAFTARSTAYADIVRTAPWHAAGVTRAVLVAPDAGDRGGTLRLVPRAAGEAVAAFWAGMLVPGWESSDGLPLTVEVCI